MPRWVFRHRRTVEFSRETPGLATNMTKPASRPTALATANVPLCAVFLCMIFLKENGFFCLIIWKLFFYFLYLRHRFCVCF